MLDHRQYRFIYLCCVRRVEMVHEAFHSGRLLIHATREELDLPLLDF
jgi:hypothetical protein